MAHTPGPWEVLEESGDFYVIGEKEWTGAAPVIARVGQYVNGEEPGADEANARLIAAAPDLLEACEAAETELKQMFKIAAMYGTDAPFYPVLDKIRAAIAKAKGGGDSVSK